MDILALVVLDVLDTVAEFNIEILLLYIPGISRHGIDTIWMSSLITVKYNKIVEKYDVHMCRVSSDKCKLVNNIQRSSYDNYGDLKENYEILETP